MLDIARHPAMFLVRTTDIANRHGTSTFYMGTILTELKNGGLIKGTRGKKGGYQLARPSSEINIADIILVLENNLCFVNCLSKDPRKQGCNREKFCVAKKLWGDARDSLLSYFETFSLDNLCGKIDFPSLQVTCFTAQKETL